MQSVDLSDLDQILERWNALLRDFPAMKKDVLRELSQRMLASVRSEIPGTGTVRSWQDRYIGSKNGYAAVRPKANTFTTTAGGKKYAVGYVTNAIENGHKHRRPSQVQREGYSYHGRINVAAVPGLHFYATVRSQRQGMGGELVHSLAADVAARLEGGT